MEADTGKDGNQGGDFSLVLINFLIHDLLQSQVQNL